MSKKKNKVKHTDFWNMTSEEQLEEQSALADMEDKGEVDIFSLGKIPMHYTGIEPEIAADISRVFGGKSSSNTAVNEEEYNVPEGAFDLDAKSSEDYISSLKEDYDDSDIHYDPTEFSKDIKVTEPKPVNNKDNVNKNKSEANNTLSNDITPIGFRYKNPIIELKDSMVSIYYKICKDPNRIRYIKDDLVYDDSVLREILYLIRDIIAFRYPSALYKFSEFDYKFDGIKGYFADYEHESKYVFIDFDDYVGVYYTGGDLIKQLKDLKVAKTNMEVADIIVGFAVESLNHNVAFTKEEFEEFYNSEANKINKDKIIDLIKSDIEPSDSILMLDVHPFNTLFDKSEVILSKYVKDTSEIDDSDLDEDFEDDDESIEDILNKEDEVSFDPEMEDLHEEDEDDDDLDEENNEEEDDTDETTNDDDINSLIEEAFNEPSNDDTNETEPVSLPIDKVAVNNPNKDDDKPMVVEVTRKTHA